MRTSLSCHAHKDEYILAPAACVRYGCPQTGNGLLEYNSRFQKAQRPSGSFTKYFYFSLYDIGMARKSAHRFGIHDFHNFKALNACAARYFCLYRRIQVGGLTRCAPYSLSNLSWLTAFSSFFPQKVRFCLPKLANLFAALPRV